MSSASETRSHRSIFAFCPSPFAVLGLWSVLAAACGGTPENSPPTQVTTFLAVTASNYVDRVGTLSLLDLDTLQVQKAIDQVDPSATVRAFDKNLYVLDSTHGSLRILDAADGFRNPKEVVLRKPGSVEAAQTNPNDLFVDTARGKAYVSLYGVFGSTQINSSTALAVVDLTKPEAGIASFVKLNVNSLDTDGNPDASRLVGCGDKLFVLLQDVDRNNGYKPSGSGRLATVGLSDPSTVGYITLAGENPTAITVFDGCTEAVVGSAGDQLGAVLSGKSGVERVDLAAGKTLGLALTDIALGGNVSTLGARDPQHVFIDLSTKNGAGYANTIFSVDALARKKGGALLGPVSFVPAVAVFGDRLAVLAAGTPGTGQLKPGLYLGATTTTALPTEPFDFGLPPSSVALVSR